MLSFSLFLPLLCLCLSLTCGIWASVWRRETERKQERGIERGRKGPEAPRALWKAAELSQARDWHKPFLCLLCFCDLVYSLLLSDSPHCSFIFVSIFLSFSHLSWLVSQFGFLFYCRFSDDVFFFCSFFPFSSVRSYCFHTLHPGHYQHTVRLPAWICAIQI